MTVQPISRRTLLRSLGAAVALPMLEAMLPARAAQAVGMRVNRMAFVFVPNGVHMPAWTPPTEGPLQLSPTLASFAPIREKVSVLSGLAQHNAMALGDGGGDHARSAATWLTGCHPHKSDGKDIRAGVSIDQCAASSVGNRTPFSSLELGCERAARAGECDAGYSCIYSSNISWRSPNTPNAHEVDPRAVFERLFGNNDPNESAQSRQLRQSMRRSILDGIQEDADRLKRQVGAKDQSKLDEYFTAVREVEQRLTQMEKLNADRTLPMRPPTGIPSDFGAHIRLMFDMLTLAYQADLTRISTVMLGNEQSNHSYKEIGVPEGHHDLSHHGGDPYRQKQLAIINRFHADQVAYFLNRLNSIKELDGTLLDNSMVVYGGGISDGDRHNHDDLPILLAGGGAGTLKQGRHLRFAPETPLNNLFISMLDRMGVHAETIGDSTGRLTTLL